MCGAPIRLQVVVPLQYIVQIFYIDEHTLVYWSIVRMNVRSAILCCMYVRMYVRMYVVLCVHTWYVPCMQLIQWGNETAVNC